MIGKKMNNIAHNFDTGTNHSHFLSTGVLDLKINHIDQPGLFKLAERQNPKRAFLFVSTVLGRHIPVSPKAHRDALDSLAAQVSPHLLEGPAFVMGYAETAVGIGAGVFDSLRNTHDDKKIGYLHTTRHPVQGEDVWFTITEGHSHATDHFIMEPSRKICIDGAKSTLILVDDETTTGTTFSELAAGLFDKGVTFGRIILVTLTDWSDGAAMKRVSDVSGGTEVIAVSLMSGSWTWTQDETAELPALPIPGVAGCPVWAPTKDTEWRSPRTGIRDREMGNGDFLAYKLRSLKVKRTQRVLIIGSGEHVWQPFLYAEALENDGTDVGFIATTRSPILPGPTIQHKISFPDHFGLGLDMYLHNVDPAEWDRIVLFTETGIDGVHPDLRRSLGKGHIVDRNGDIFEMMGLEGTAV
jgi:hypothetical protein